MFKLDDLELDLDVDDDVLNGAFNVNNPTTDSSFNNINTETVLRSKPQKKNVEETSRSSKFVNEEKNVCNNKILPQRKFPGPAGILPDIPLKDLNNSLIPLDQSNTEEIEIIKNESVIYSQTSASVFEEPPYLKLLSDFDMNDSNSPLNKYTIDWVKKKAISKVIHSIKIPFLAVVVHHIDHSMPDPVLILRDRTGEILGTLHREVWNDMHGKFHPGCALALRKVGVLNTGTRRQIFLTITNKNILSVYSAADDIQEVDTTNVHRMSSTDLIKSIDDWQAQAQATSSNTPKTNSSNNSLFLSINQNSPNHLKRQINQSTPIKKPISNKPATSCDFDISIDDINFDDFSEEKTSDQNKNSTGIQFQPKFDIEVRYKKPVLKKQETEVVPSIFKPKINSSQVLTQEENQMVEEVLDGIDLDDFDL